ncbi:MAG: indole-3-glycerol phosphate synthase TrpC [Armatimonadetes bacterium]|nr:indole-3-glycerol phosphate synthase TrpC [Armatimonadota bacterium]
MDLLSRILQKKRSDVQRAKAATPLSEVKAAVADAAPVRNFRKAIDESPHPVALIAEVKKASPVTGITRPDFDPAEIAAIYKDAGADCLSVLTDVEFFQGSPDYLALCRDVSGLPVLRKDFTVDEYNVWEARAMGADAVLLIVAALSPPQLTELRELAESLGMDALVEAHSLEQAEAAISTGATLLGVNNRDLTTFESTISESIETIPKIAGRATVVSESAIATRQDVEAVASAGARAVLVGTSFCSAPDVGARVREVMGW